MIKDPQYGKSHFNHPDYTVTRDGRVYSWKSGKPELREIRFDSKGTSYYSMDGIRQQASYLVMTIWGGDQMDNKCKMRNIRYIDGNKANNDLDNLCYATQAEYNEFKRWYNDYMSEIEPLLKSSY